MDGNKHKMSVTPGDDTAYNQQYRMLRRMGHNNPQLKKQFITDLIKVISNLKQTGKVNGIDDPNWPIHGNGIYPHYDNTKGIFMRQTHNRSHTCKQKHITINR